MTYENCSLCGITRNPLFILNRATQRAINDGPLHKAMCINVLLSLPEPLYWRFTLQDVMSAEEIEHVQHVQATVQEQIGKTISFVRAFEIMLCFGDDIPTEL